MTFRDPWNTRTELLRWTMRLEHYHRSLVVTRLHAWWLRRHGWTPVITDLRHEGAGCMLQATQTTVFGGAKGFERL